MSGILNFMGNGGIMIALVLLVIACVVSLIRPAIDLVTNFSESKKALIGILGVAVLFLIGFALSSGEVPPYAVDKGISPKTFKLIGAGINTAIIATAIMALYLVVDLVMGIVRN